jgi:hypothetical protein
MALPCGVSFYDGLQASIVFSSPKREYRSAYSRAPVPTRPHAIVKSGKVSSSRERLPFTKTFPRPKDEYRTAFSRAIFVFRKTSLSLGVKQAFLPASLQERATRRSSVPATANDSH